MTTWKYTLSLGNKDAKSPTTLFSHVAPLSFVLLSSCVDHILLYFTLDLLGTEMSQRGDVSES